MKSIYLLRCKELSLGMNGDTRFSPVNIFIYICISVEYPGRLFVGGGGFQQIRLRAEDREKGDLGAVSPLVRGSRGSCTLLQEIPFHIVKVS